MGEENLLEGLLREAEKPTAVLEGEPWVAARPAPRLVLEWLRPARPPTDSVWRRGLAAVLLRGEEGRFVSSKLELGTTTGAEGTEVLVASANSSKLTVLLPSESILLMMAITSPSVAMKPLSLRKDWMFLWLRE